jgi:hypothetical protein
MNQPESVESIDRDSMSRPAAQQSRPMGSPLPMGSGRRPAISQGAANRVPSNPPGRALAGSTSGEEHSGTQRAINLFRSVMPIVQRLLPLLEGNVLTAVSNMLTPRPQAAPPPPKVDLAPLESSLAEMQTQHRGLREQVIEQNASLKRVEDQLEMVREATDRNTLEQQELLEDIKTFSSKVKVVAIVGIGVLVISVVLNLILFMHIERVLP